MARVGNKLSDSKVKSSTLKPGLLSDGGGLYLNVKPSGTRSWVFVWKQDGRRREKGLGAYPAVPLVKARQESLRMQRSHSGGARPHRGGAEGVSSRLSANALTSSWTQWKSDGGTKSIGHNGG